MSIAISEPKVKERPILFAGEMVRAILEGRKTQTRRVVKRIPMFGEALSWCAAAKAQEPGWVHIVGDYRRFCPFGQVGDRLWVRESFTYWERPDDGEDFLVYKTDDSKRSLAEWEHPHPIYEHCVGRFGKTIPSIHMPRWASRITLEITGVRVERLQEISEEDAWAEGCKRGEPTSNGGFFPAEEADPSGIGMRGWDSPQDWFADLWENIYGTWENNPWVWVIEFRRIENV